MSSTPSRDGPDDRDPSWANESLPLSLRRQLLQRELQQLGFPEAAAGPRAAGAVQQQQQPQPASQRPQAAGADGTHSE